MNPAGYLKDKWETILGIVVTLVLGLWAILPSEKREPTLVIVSSTEILSESHRAIAPLVIQRSDGKPIERGLYSVTVAFWNKGSKPIRKSEVLSPVGVYLSDSLSHIISFKLLSVSRPVCGITIANDTSKDSEGVKFDFTILEQDDGFQVQIFYDGSSTTEIRYSGVIEGVKRITTTAPISYFSLTRHIALTFLGGLLLFAGGMLIFVGFIYLDDYIEKKLLKRVERKFGKFARSFTKFVWSAVGLAFGLVILWFTIRPFFIQEYNRQVTDIRSNIPSMIVDTSNHGQSP